MSGIRLHHSVLKAAIGSTLTYVVDIGTPLGRIRECPDCGKEHATKSIHLRLDHQGDVIVSKEVYAALGPRLADAGLVYENEVAKPPPLSIGAVEVSKREIVELPMNPDEAPADKIAPGRTKYESRDRMEKVAPKAKAKRKAKT